LSEGEKTCVALAAFLTELATAQHASALVFDDPVSSLDHRWRSSVAKRLVDEAKKRQVIVFTHDLVFVNDLLDRMEGQEPRMLTLSREP
jgi:wobble nucleotide-excising tRNase